MPIIIITLLVLACAAPPVLACQSPAAGDDSNLTERAVVFELSADVQQSDGAEAASPSNDWRVQIGTYVWGTGIEGDMGVQGVTANVSANVIDIIQASDSVFAFAGRLEVGKGRWGGYIDGTYAKLGVDDASGPGGVVNIDVTSELFLSEFAAMYRISEWTPDGKAAENARNAVLDLYAGGRYTDLKVTIDPRAPPSQDGSRDWIDPIVGTRLLLPFSKSWHLEAFGDVGGFGTGSDFTWSATSMLGVDFSMFNTPTSAYFGYRALGQDYTDGSGSEQFTWDVILHGPVAGLTMKF